MEVRIRLASEGTSRYLTQSSLDRLDQIIPTLKAWGVAGSMVPDNAELTGQIWVDPEGSEKPKAFFEVVIHDDAPTVREVIGT